MIQPYQEIPKSMTAEDAIEAAYVKLKRQFQNRVWSDADLVVMKQQLTIFEPEWILSACDDVIGAEEFYSVSEMRKHCLGYREAATVEAREAARMKLYAGPDPFAEALGVGDKPVDVNRKLLRVQLAWMADQRSKGIIAPKKIPFGSPEEKKLRENIREFDGVHYSQLADKTRQVLGCE
jgi:hypothetical protein